VKVRAVAALIAIAAAGAVAWRFVGAGGGGAADVAPVTLRGPADVLTVALTGTTAVAGRWPAAGTDRAFDRVGEMLRHASLALTDLEEPLVDGEMAADDRVRPRWLTGDTGVARALRAIGMSVVTRANDHAADLGRDGILQTARILSDVGLLHAGAGLDLAAARAPAVIGAPPHRVAVIAVATSVLPAARATRARGEIRGRPGVNALRYSAIVTADPSTFAVLTELAAARGHEATSHQAELTFSGTVIKKGDRTTVTLAADEGDLAELLAAIRQTRAAADLVIVSLHTHEPANWSEAPAEFAQRLARAAIDAGASVVVGHGARRLRGIELYKKGAIFYGLGSFAFDLAAVNPDAADIFDTDLNLYDVALGTADPRMAPKLAAYAEPFWWESAIAILGFDKSAVASMTLFPLDLGQRLASRDRGIPRVATVEEGRQILEHVASLSAPFGTRLTIADGVGRVKGGILIEF
jgi:poly-gamma-glutamate capsule biosynthesis protein CapA/YwtB (metallophosphatase superfamily)